jgi:hypothetical protein|tara:strand:- start:616 stop:1179 length:564 start_codon:yes stop_codon:yes gene_type:complete
MILLKILKITILMALVSFTLSSCKGGFKGADARKYPPNPEERVKKNIEEGRGFRLSDSFSMGGSGNFEFASSNPLWRATLDSISFMPLASVNYGGGIIITDWYSTNDTDESIKISVRFLTNEIRSDALDIKIFSRKCKTASNCIISEKPGKIVPELELKILRTASIYAKQQKVKNFRPYKGFDNERD